MNLSVITVCRNSEKTLLATLESVRKYKGEVKFEYLVIDGASTDGSLSLIERNTDLIDVLVSEPDRGIYDAMNKGVLRAEGQYVYFLNSDDRFAEGFPEAARSLVDKDFYGAAVLFWSSGRRLDHLARVALTDKGDLALDRTASTFIPHQGMFLRRSLALALPFRVTLRVMADFDQQLALLEGDYSFEALEAVVANFHAGGASSGDHHKEHGRVLRDHLGFYNNRLSSWERKMVFRSALRASWGRPTEEFREFLSELEVSWVDRTKERLLSRLDRFLGR